MVNLVHSAAQNIVIVGFISYLLVVTPVIGIMLVHKSTTVGGSGEKDKGIDAKAQ